MALLPEVHRDISFLPKKALHYYLVMFGEAGSYSAYAGEHPPYPLLRVSLLVGALSPVNHRGLHQGYLVEGKVARSLS